MIWLDAQLPPSLATWIRDNFEVECLPVRELGLRDAPDFEIFQQAKAQNVIVMTKDKDFTELLYAHKSPPKVIWLTCGNTSKNEMKNILTRHLNQALRILELGNDLVEIQ